MERVNAFAQAFKIQALFDALILPAYSLARFAGRFPCFATSNLACLTFSVGLIVRLGCVIAELRDAQSKGSLIISV